MLQLIIVGYNYMPCFLAG